MRKSKLLLWLCLVALLAGCSLPTGDGGGIPQIFGPTATPSAAPTPTVTLTPTPSPTPIPEVRVESGDLALFYGDYTHARDEYQIAASTAADPEVRAAALWGLGRVEYADGNTAGALDYLRQLISTYPGSTYSAYGLFLSGEIYAELDRFSEAVSAYDAYLALRPGQIDAYAQERRGNVLAESGDYSGAIAAYQAALIAVAPAQDLALEVKLAQAYADAGDAITAIGMYDSIALRSSNEYLQAQMDFLAGQLYLQRGESDLAYERFQHAVNNYPLAYDSYSALVELVNAGVPVDELNRGLVDYFAGQYGVALMAFDRYLATYPQNDGTVHYYRALTLRELTRYSEAVTEFTFFIQNYPDNRYWQTAWDDQAYVQWAYLDQYEAAAQTLLDFVAYVPASPYAPQALLSAGRILERADLLDEAAAVWERIGDAYPSSQEAAQGLFWAGIARYRKGDLDGALLTFQRSLLLALTPEDQARASFWIGKTQQRRGDAAAAQAAWQQAAGLDPTGYYTERSRDMLLGQIPFQPPPAYDLAIDYAAERAEAETWTRITFALSSDTDLSSPGALLQDARLIRGTELWRLGLYNEASLEFEELRAAVEQNPVDCYRLMNYLLDLGMYRTAIFLDRQILTLAGMQTQASTLGAPRYFQHVRYGTYYQPIILPVAEQKGFHPLLLFSIVRQESLFEGYVSSSAGARGLMQIIPSTGDMLAYSLAWPPNYTDTDLYRPLVSITYGGHYLMNNRNNFGGDLYAALAAYNGGPGNAAIWLQMAGGDQDLFAEVIRYQETRDYIRSIYENFVMYRNLYGRVP